MLSFRALSEKKTKIKINPKQAEITEMENNHGEDCDCMKCEKKRRKERGEKEVATEAKYYDPMEDDTFDHDEAERTRGQSGKPAKKKTKKTTKEETAYVSQEEVSEESNQESETETFLTFGQFCEGMTMKDFKANRRNIKRKEASADAKKRGHVGKEWYNSGRTYSSDEAKRGRAKMDDEERRTRHRTAVDPDNENDNNFSADKTKNPKKLRKQKAMGEARNAYAVGMAAAMKQTGDKPPLEKSTITKAHKIAKAIKKEEVEQFEEGIRSTIAGAGLAAAVAAHGGIGKKAETHKSPAPEKSQATQVSKKKETKTPEQIWREKHPNLAAKEDSKKKPASVKSQLSDIGDMIARSKARQQQNNSFKPEGEQLEEGRAEDAQASLAKVKARQKVLDAHEKKTGRKLDISKSPEHKAHKKEFPGAKRTGKKVPGAKETALQTHNRRVQTYMDRLKKHGKTTKQKRDDEAMAKHTSRYD